MNRDFTCIKAEPIHCDSIVLVVLSRLDGTERVIMVQEQVSSMMLDESCLSEAMGWLGGVGEIMARVILKHVMCKHREDDTVGKCKIASIEDGEERFFMLEWSPEEDGKNKSSDSMMLAEAVLEIYKPTLDLTKDKRFLQGLQFGFKNLLKKQEEPEMIFSMEMEEEIASPRR